MRVKFMKTLAKEIDIPDELLKAECIKKYC